MRRGCFAWLQENESPIRGLSGVVCGCFCVWLKLRNGRREISAPRASNLKGATCRHPCPSSQDDQAGIVKAEKFGDPFKAYLPVVNQKAWQNLRFQLQKVACFVFLKGLSMLPSLSCRRCHALCLSQAFLLALESVTASLAQDSSFIPPQSRPVFCRGGGGGVIFSPLKASPRGHPET